MEQSGFTVQRLDRGGIIEYLGAKVRVVVGEDGAAAIQGWSFPWSRRRKLGYVAERILLASGMQAFCRPHCTNLIYRISEEPTSEWLTSVKPEGTKIHNEPGDAVNSAKGRYQCGRVESSTKSIRFWTGLAINPESQVLAYYFALDADAASVTGEPLLRSLDSTLVAHGATRIETQRKLDR